MKNVHFGDIQRALLPKHGHKPGTSHNYVSSRARRGLMPKVLVKQTNGNKSLCLLPDAGHKATIPNQRGDLVSTYPEAAEG